MTLDDAVAPRFELSSGGARCSSVAWLKNKEQRIDDKMTDMDTDRILCNRPQNRYAECSGLAVVGDTRIFHVSPPPWYLFFSSFSYARTPFCLHPYTIRNCQDFNWNINQRAVVRHFLIK